MKKKKKKKKNDCQNNLTVCALPETENRVNSFQVDLYPPHHRKISVFDIFRWLKRVA